VPIVLHAQEALHKRWPMAPDVSGRRIRRRGRRGPSTFATPVRLVSGPSR